MQSACFSPVSTRILYSALYNWILDTQNQKKNCLCVDDFGVKYFTKDDANNLLAYLKNHYSISTDWEGYNCLDLKIYWNYSEEYVDISMPEYVKKALDTLKHPKPEYPNIPHISGQHPPMVKDSKWHQIHTIANFLTRNPPK